MVTDARAAQALAQTAHLLDNPRPAPAQPGFAGDIGMTSDGQQAAAARMAAAPTAGERTPAPQLRALLLCDLAPTALAETGDEAGGVPLVREHDRLVRELLAAHGGFEADKTDGFLALFERPIQAVAFALDYQRHLHALRDSRGQPLAGRVGIHVGDVVTWNNSSEDVRQGARQVEVEGLAKPVAARLMHLARPGQVLLSSIALALAQRAQDELGETTARVRWLGHGPYRFKGVPAPMVVHEVGEAGIAPLKPPPSDDKALRETPWWRRPAAIAAELATVLAVVLALFMLSGRPQPAIAFIERDWVVVGDLRNLTPDPSLSEALEVAFRISLEQSRHVNVLSDLKVRDTLRRMQREPGTPLDRETGAEVALREGARALILPSVAEVGGRVRVSAEVIDPTTLTTVYAESHDGVGVESTLRSMDRVTGALRARLGEALQGIESDSRPLPEVSTPSLEALKLYGDALSAMRDARFAEAAEGFRQALAIDPEFALAHVGLGRIGVAAGRIEQAREYMAAAFVLKHRLTARDALYVEAWLASFGSLEALQDRWRLLSSLYPDEFASYYNAAQFYWHHGAGYERALALNEKAISSRNPFAAAAAQQKGVLLLAMNRFDEALEAFAESDRLGFAGLGSLHAMALIALDRHDEAAERLARGTRYGVPGIDQWNIINTSVLALDQGRLNEALAILRGATEQADLELAVRVRLLGAQLMLETALFGDDVPIALRDSYCAASEDVPFDDGLQSTWMVRLLCARVHAAAGDDAVALAALADLNARGPKGFPAVEAMASVVQATLLLRRGNATEAAAVLAAAADSSELYIVRAARVEALAEAGDIKRALRLAETLVGERGRALGEWNNYRLLLPFNVAHNRLLGLRIAELALAERQLRLAERHLGAFLAHWPESTTVEAIARRVAAIEAGLQPSSL
jgi:putative peptide modification system cyclase